VRGYLGTQSRGGGQGGGQQGGGQGGGRSNRSNRGPRNDNRNGNTNGGRPPQEDYGDLPEGGDDLEIIADRSCAQPQLDESDGAQEAADQRSRQSWPRPMVSRTWAARASRHHLRRAQGACAQGEDIYATACWRFLQDGFRLPAFLRLELSGGPDDIMCRPARSAASICARRFDIPDDQAPKDGERYFALLKVGEINFDSRRVRAARCCSRISLRCIPRAPETGARQRSTEDLTARAIDLVAPIGKGQRGLIVSPPKAGKTMLLQNIATAIRPIIRRCTSSCCSSTSGRGSHRDGAHGEGRSRIVHLRRAGQPPRAGGRDGDRKSQAPGRTQEGRGHPARFHHSPGPRLQYRGAELGQGAHGGVDANALQRPKRFFGAARNIEEGGSLTILATALVDTGSKMDDVIFEEFKGTGNSEIHLDRRIAEKRTFPSININRSGTRKEELITEPSELSKMWILRKLLHPMDELAAIEFLLDKMKDTKTNPDSSTQ